MAKSHLPPRNLSVRQFPLLFLFFSFLFCSPPVKWKGTFFFHPLCPSVKPCRMKEENVLHFLSKKNGFAGKKMYVGR